MLLLFALSQTVFIEGLELCAHFLFMTMKNIILATALAASPIIATAADEKDPITSLQIDQIHHLTTTNGKIIPRSILFAQVGNAICLHMPDGTEYKGIVLRREEALKESVKIIGELFNKDEQCGFGLYVSVDGQLEGAVVFRGSQRTYVVEYDEASKAFVFKFKKSDKPAAIN